MKGPTAGDGELASRVRALLASREVREQRMFGGLCFMLNGNMALGTHRGDLLVRVGKEGNDAALARPHARQMHMGRPAVGYVMVAAEGTRRDRDLKAWVDLALAHNATLPAKAAKAPKAAKPAKAKSAPARARRGSKSA